jgi:DNA-binding CsgD family transcriptional regulator
VREFQTAFKERGQRDGYEDLMERRTKLAEFSKTLTRKDLDELFKDAPQQRKILELLGKNPEITDKEIAVELRVETKTVSNQVSKLLKRFGAKNRNELAPKLPPPSNPA